MSRLELVEDEIARKLAEAERSGELRSAAGYGKPLTEDVAWAQTPAEFRMPFKILKDSGFVPPEVMLFHERARLRSELQTASSDAERTAVQHALSSLEQKLSVRLESLSAGGSL
jgi:Domain of unknown function (DUF1992)